MAILMNSIRKDVFNTNSAEFQSTERERAYIVTCGRLLMMERNGRDNNALRVLEKKSEDYTPQLTDLEGGKCYAQVNRGLQEKLMLYCAKVRCNATGETAPADYGEFYKAQRRFMSDAGFLRILAGVISEIVTPMLPATMSNGLGWMAETTYVPLGQTKEIDVMSNDIFLFEDDSWGASRSKPSNYLYSKPVTLNPTLRTAKATIKWYQMVGNDVDLGRFFNSIAAGLYSKVTALWVSALVSATNNTAFVPSNLKFTNSSANWVTAANRVALLNGTRYRNVIGVGTPQALTKALPSGVVNASTVNLDAALSTMLGVDWARYGYLGEYMGVNLMPIDNAIVPGTQNTSITEIVPTDTIWLMATSGYKPVYVAFEEGTPIQIVLDPSKTADMTIDILVSASMDVKPVVASKIAVIDA